MPLLSCEAGQESRLVGSRDSRDSNPKGICRLLEWANIRLNLVYREAGGSIVDQDREAQGIAFASRLECFRLWGDICRGGNWRC